MGHQNRFYLVLFLFVLIILPLSSASAKIDLATLTERQSVQTTIYKQADLTLVRDKRTLSFVPGINFLQFSWANTKIDPTSLFLDIKKGSNALDILEITYPPGTKDMGIWHIKADKACQVPVEITYFTSGISWASYYTILLSTDLKECTLANHVMVSNHSGEDYTNAQTRLVVGKISLLDKISALSARQYPYGRPVLLGGIDEDKNVYQEGIRMLKAAPVKTMMARSAAPAPKEIKKQALSEYFLYTIQGEESIPDGWSKRLLSFKADKVRIKNIYRYEKKRYGKKTIRFLSLKNDKENKLGLTPLPGGNVNVFKKIGEKGELNFIGTDTTRYIPVGKKSGKAELNLGQTLNVKINPKVMKFEKKNIIFDSKNNVNGFDEIKTYTIEFSNFTDNQVIAEYTQNMDAPQFEITQISHQKNFEKTDQDTIKFTLDLAPHSTQKVLFTLTTMRGERRWQQ